jgi:hypothetical protein
MPTYRIYYAEREAPEGGGHRRPGQIFGDDLPIPAGGGPLHETEWEEEIEAASEAEALDAFFREHAPDRFRIGFVDDEGNSRAVEGFDFDPDATYIWTENDRMMEYQGIDEATPGMVTCPLCNGHGEVDEETATEFEEVWSEEEDALRGDVSG